MTKQLIVVTLAMGFAILNAVPSEAATRVQIPFEFQVAGATLPAGSYSIQVMSGDVIRFKNTVTKEMYMIPTVTKISLQIPSEAKIVFNRYGDAYFLAEIWWSGTSAERAVRKSDREVQLSKRIQGIRVESTSAMRR